MRKYSGLNIEIYQSVIFSAVLIIVFSCLIVYPFSNVLAEEKMNLETSIVLLKIKVKDEIKQTEPFFEILDFPEDDYQLVPLSMISSFLDLNINFNREKNILTVVNPEDKQEVIINFNTGKYIGHEDWSEEEPIMFSGDFFISLYVLEYLFDIKSEWVSAYQELILSGDYFLSEKEKEAKQEEKEESREDLEEEKYDIKGEDFSLGSIHYKIQVSAREKLEDENTLKGNQEIYLYGRLGDWALSLGESGSIDFKEGNSDFSLKKIEAEYRKNNKLIIIGDRWINYEKTIGEKDFRGVYYRFPEDMLSKIFAYTSISGEAEEGTEVTLYIDDIPYRKIEVGVSKSYQFENIRLNNYRLNSLKIVLKNKSGEEKVIEKKVAASPRLFVKNTKELEVAAGLYTDENKDYWQGEMVGLKYYYSPSNKFSYSMETLINRQKADVEREGILLASDMGIAFGMGDNTVATFDWYVAEEDSEYYSGSGSSFLYTFKNGYLKTDFNYIPEKTAEGIQKNEGKDIKITGLRDFGEGWSAAAGLSFTESLIPENSYQRKMADLSLIYNKDIFNYLNINGSYSKIHSLYENYLTGFEIPGDNNRYGLCIENDLYREGFRFNTELELFNNNIGLANGIKYNYQDIYFENIFFKKLFTSLFFSNEINAYGIRKNEEFSNLDLFNSGRLKYYLNDKTSITFSREYYENEEADIFEKEDSLNISHSLNHNILMNTGVNNHTANRSMDYKLYYLNFSYNLLENSNIGLYYDYVLPIENNYDKHQSYRIDYTKSFTNERELNITLGKEYRSILSSDYEYYFTVSLSQALGFVGDKIINQKFNSSGHKSAVSGLVFLDENNNKKYDQGEKLLPDIMMSLDNIRSRTGEKGSYKLEVMFPGIYTLNFDYNELLADYTPVTEEKKILIEKNSNIYYNFGLTLNGMISGTIFLDENADGICNEGEEPLQWVGVKLNDRKTVYTDKRGEFYFENVPLGKHILTIIQESLPVSVTTKDGFEWVANITEERLDIEDISIPMVYDY